MFKRHQRSEQALVLALMEMVVSGVSTRKVTAITEELCVTSFSESTVSQLAQALDERVAAWKERDLSQLEYPFIIVDAIVFKVRRDEAVRSTSCLIAIGINSQGVREILGLRLGDSESEATWADMFQWLKARGLKGVELITSDSHKGLVKAAQRQFQGVIWQRCQFHLCGNVLGVTPVHLRAKIGDGLKRIFASSDKKQSREAFTELAASLDGKAQRAMEVLGEGMEDALAVLVLPAKCRSFGIVKQQANLASG
jgi:transposase-like protein